jgi:anti-sigma regulatory factor (Ser/Thr protein kinase)
MPDQRRAELPATYASAALARDLVGQACTDWRLGEVLHPARLIASELATNAIEHARTPFLVVLSLRGPMLHLAVQDGDPRLPRLLDPGTYDPFSPLADRGRGLRVVAGQATSWGAMPSRYGKVVWATLRTEPLT